MSSSPSTPISRHSLQYTYRPLNSSPLASPSPSGSISERRRLQFKSHTPITRSSTLPSSSPSNHRHTPSSRTRSIASSSSTLVPHAARSSREQQQRQRQPVPQFNHPEDPQKEFLRGRIKAKCIERAQKARARAVKKRRYTGYSDRSSDGFECDDDEDGYGDSTRMDDLEEDDDFILNDEFFRRVMAQMNHKTDHSYRLSYAHEVGSSFDPDIEDIAEWEHEVQGHSEFSFPDFDEEELEAYAGECARQAVLDDLADIPEEELFHLSDVDDLVDEHEASSNTTIEHMDLS